MQSLFILGNGFDLHHKLPTRYKNYRCFLQAKYPWLVSDYETFAHLDCDGDDRWMNIERALCIDYVAMLEKLTRDDALNVDTYRLDLADALLEVDESMRFIFDFTGEAFAEWVATIGAVPADPDLSLPAKSAFVTFNYTNTLERLYDVDSGDILHLHGAIDMVDPAELVPADYEVVYPAQIPEDIDFPEVVARKDEPNNTYIRGIIKFGNPTVAPGDVRTELETVFEQIALQPSSLRCVDRIAGYAKATFKDLSANYGILREFLGKRPFDTVVVFGHSFDGVDMPYYSDVFAPMLRDCRWVFWERVPEQRKAAIDRFCTKLDIRRYAVTGIGEGLYA